MTDSRDDAPPPPDEASRPSAPSSPAVAPTPRPRRATSVAPQSDLWAGKIRVQGEVGSGAMAEILRGYDTKLRRDVALKVTKLSRKDMPRQQLARFAE